MSEEQKPNVEQIEFKPASIEAIIAADKAIKEVKRRSFSGRHPELGKMIKCQVCKLRHRAPLDKDQKPVTTCVQKFAVKHYEQVLNEETKEWGPETVVYRTAAMTRNGIIGAAQFNGKRLKPHPSRVKLIFIERVRKAFDYLKLPLESSPEAFKENLNAARKLAGTWIRIEMKLKSRAKRHMQNVSRRINNGLATPGSR